MSDEKNEKPKSLFDDEEVAEGEEKPTEESGSKKETEKEVAAEETTQMAAPLSKKTKKKKSYTKTVLLIVFILFIGMLGIFLGLTIMGKKQESFKSTATTKSQDKTTTTTTTTTKPAGNIVYVTSEEGLRLRKEASLSSDVVTTMPYGAALTVTEENGDWIKIEYNNNVGWCSKTYTSTTNPLVYKDTNYGFEITFPETWNTYKFFKKETTENGETYVYYYVGLKTNDPEYLSGALSDSSVDKGYVSLFALDVFTKAQWEKAKTSEGPQPTLLTESTNYVFAYSLPNGTVPTDLSSRVKEVKDILKTFKVF